MFRFKSQPNQSFFTKLSFSKSMLGHCLPFLDCFESYKKFFCSKIRNLDQCGFILQNTIVNFSLVFPKALKIRCFDGHHTLFCLLSFKATETQFNALFLCLLHSSCNLFRKLICCLQYKRSKRVLNSLSLSFLKGSSSLFKFPCATAIKVISGSDKSSSLHLLLKCLHPKYQWHTERKRCETYLCVLRHLQVFK